MSSIAVQNRTLFPSPSQGIAPAVLLDPVATTMTVAELIQQTVAQQIAALQQQRAMQSADAARAIERHYLTSKEISAQAQHGTIRFPTSHADQTIGDITTAVKQAWQAFERRVYIIVIDGKIARSLEEEIACGQDRQATFLRLVPLVGG